MVFLEKAILFSFSVIHNSIAYELLKPICLKLRYVYKKYRQQFLFQTVATSHRKLHKHAVKKEHAMDCTQKGESEPTLKQ